MEQDKYSTLRPHYAEANKIQQLKPEQPKELVLYICFLTASEKTSSQDLMQMKKDEMSSTFSIN